MGQIFEGYSKLLFSVTSLIVAIFSLNSVTMRTTEIEILENYCERELKHQELQMPNSLNNFDSNKTTVNVLQRNADKLDDLTDYLIQSRTGNNSASFENVVINTFKSNSDVKTLGNLLNLKINENSTSLRKFHAAIDGNFLYRQNDKNVDNLLKDLVKVPIVKVEEMEGGTQLKLIIHYANGMRALFKPMRFSIEKQENPDHSHYSYFENPRAEIAAFHLDRALGFNRVMPTIGRKLNMKTEMYDVADEDLKETFFKSPVNNTCFHGSCHWYCDIHHAVCGNGNIIEGSFAAFLPFKEDGWVTKEVEYPWRRSYDMKSVQWENDPNFCEKIKSTEPYNIENTLLDLIDMAILDFLMDNRDRHDYEVIKQFGESSYILHLDHGRAFARPFDDDRSLLTPIKQCCQIRESTLNTLLNFQKGTQKLSQVMRASLANDPIAPVLWEPHLEALDRRVPIVLEHVRDCIAKKGHSMGQTFSV